VPLVHIEGPMDGDHLSTITRTYDLTAGHDIYAWLLGHTNDSAQ
jgi:hypothetical protein